jgi:hypothetical protein
LHGGEITIVAGLLIGLAGLGLTFRQVGRRFWGSREQARPRSAKYVEGVGDLASPAVLWGGMILIQFGNLAAHVNDGAFPGNLSLSLVSSASGIFAFGLLLGRLHMRWQLRSLLAQFDEEATTP